MMDVKIANKSNPLVSIIMPVYNGSNFLKQAIDSALNQTYKNIEIIVINDGSNDNGLTEGIVKSYGDKIRYIYKENGGVATALNVGIQNASGDYISWLSHDDLYFENKIDKQINYLSSISVGDVILYSDYTAIDADDKFILHARIACGDNFNHKQEFLLNMFKARIHGCSLLIPRKCFSAVGYFDERLRTTQDYDLWFKLVKNGFEFRHMPELLISSRWHKEQGTYTLHKIAHGEIEALYINAVDMFYEDIDRFSARTVMELIVDLRERRIGKTANHMLKSIKRRNKALYREMRDLYAAQLIKSQLKLMTAKPREIVNAIVRRSGLGGKA